MDQFRQDHFHDVPDFDAAADAAGPGGESVFFVHLPGEDKSLICVVSFGILIT